MSCSEYKQFREKCDSGKADAELVSHEWILRILILATSALSLHKELKDATMSYVQNADITSAGNAEDLDMNACHFVSIIIGCGLNLTRQTIQDSKI
jgi:hypothetical protein